MSGVSEQLLTELKTIIQEDYGIGLESDDVQSIANFLLQYFETLIQVENKEGGE